MPIQQDIQKAHDLFMRASARFLSPSVDENILKTKGLLRESGNILHIERMIKKNILEENADVNDYIGVLKQSIKNIEKPLAEIAPLEIASLRDNYNSLTTPAKKAEAINAFIDTLARSKNPEKEKIAEMLYTYIRLGQAISEHADINLMPTDNVSMVLAPAFTNIIFPFDAIAYEANLANVRQTLNALHHDFTQPFAEVYVQTAERALLLEAKKVVQNHRTSRMAKEIYKELSRRQKEHELVDFIPAVVSLYSEYEGDKNDYKKRILKLCSKEFAVSVKKALDADDLKRGVDPNTRKPSFNPLRSAQERGKKFLHRITSAKSPKPHI